MIVDMLLSSEADTVAEFEYVLSRPIGVEVDSRYNQEQYDILLD